MKYTILINLYTALFARPWLYGFNKFLYRCGLRGLGVLNYQTDYVSGELAFLKRHLKGRSSVVVLDVGANIGAYSKAVAAVCPQALIYAFEPHPRTYETLCMNVKDLGVRCFNTALGARDGTVELHDYADWDGSSHASIYRDVIENTHGSQSVAHKVKMICLDDFLKENNIDSVTLLKIDTEGHEFSVISGTTKCLEEGRIEAIQFEFNEMNVSSRTFLRDFWGMLPNYDFFRLLPNGMIKIEISVPMYCEIYAYQNIVAISKSTDKVVRT